jgi:hypothetical protein
MAFEKHRIRLRMAAGAWRDYHESIHARLPFVHSCTADAAVQENLPRRRADERVTGYEDPLSVGQSSIPQMAAFGGVPPTSDIGEWSDDGSLHY